MNKLTILILCLALPLTSFGQYAPLGYGFSASRSLDVDPEPRLGSNAIIDILPGSAPQEVWLGTGNGVTRVFVNESGGRTYDFRTWSEAQGLGKGGISGMATSDSIIWVSFAFDTTVGVSGAGGGMAYTRDSGENWTWFPQPRDRIYDLNRDTGFDNVLGYWPTATNVDNITFAIAMSEGSVWSASKGGGLRRHFYDGDYTNYNDTTGWQIVTPDTFKFNPLEHLNHRTFSVIYDGEAIWVGSAEGISKSTDEGETWSRYTAASHGISGNFVTALAYQEATGAIWAATWRAESSGEFYAVSRTLDGGDSWTVHLDSAQVTRAIGRDVGLRAHGFGFDGEIVYVSDDMGLWKSNDLGASWDLFTVMSDSTNPGVSFAEPEIFSAFADNDLLWAGGSDGLAVSQSDGARWHILQAALPLSDSERPTDTYAYPNPYSPQRQSAVRFRFTSPGGQVGVKIYDFGMSEVASLPAVTVPSGEQYVTWDGRKDGTVVANGTYFYKLDKPGGEVWGKVIILD